MSSIVNLGSALRGIKAMHWRHAKVIWSVRRVQGWWIHLWTPAWHEGRGPYVSIGLGWIAIYRGY